MFKNLDEIFLIISFSVNNEMGEEDVLNIKKVVIVLRGDLVLLKVNFEVNELFFILEDVIFKIYMFSFEFLLIYMKINFLD